MAAKMVARTLMAVLALLGAGCASYVTPGGPANLDAFDRASIAEAAARRPTATFPARLAVARLQAPQYRSHTADVYVDGRVSVMTTRELLTDSYIETMDDWPSVAGVAPVNRLLLPDRVDSLSDIRQAAARVQADILLLYTIDTGFRVQGRGYGPLSLISLGLTPDRDARVTSTASAMFVDVRTGFVYGLSESTAKTEGLANAWNASDTIDKKRLEAERQSFDDLVRELSATWHRIVATSHHE